MGTTTIQVPMEFIAAFRHYATEEFRRAADYIEDDAAIFEQGSSGENAVTVEELVEEASCENPHQAAYDRAFPPYTEADQAVQDFKREHAHDRLAELEPDQHKAVEVIREGFELVRQGCERYRVSAKRGAPSSLTPRACRESRICTDTTHASTPGTETPWRRLRPRSHYPPSLRWANGGSAMSDDWGAANDFARMAAQARGQEPSAKQARNRRTVEAFHPSEPAPKPEPNQEGVSELAAKREAHRRLVEAMHPAEPQAEPDQEAEDLTARLLTPKPVHAELIRLAHGSEGLK